MPTRQPRGDKAAAAKPPPPKAPPKAPPPEDRRLKWTPTPYVKAGLICLEALGIFGEERSQVLNHIIGEELRRLLESGLLKPEVLEREVKHLAERPPEPDD